MSNKKHDWTQQLPEAFEGYTEAEPEGLWDAVQGSLTPQKKKVAAWWWSAAGLAAAASIALGVFLFRPEPAAISSNYTAVISSAPSVISSAPSVISSESEKSAASSLRAEAAESQGATSASRPVRGPVRTAGFLPASATPASGSSSLASDNNQDTGKGIEEIEEIEELKEKEETEELEGTDKKQPGLKNPSRVRKPNEIRIKYGLASGGLLAQDVSRTSSGFGLPAAYPGMPLTKAAGIGSGLNPVMLSRNKPSTTTATHHRSARFGLTLTATVNDRWGLESGLMLTTLTSRYESETAAASSTTDRSMTYLGIPLYAHYRIWGWRRLNVYAIGGPMFEWSVSTRTETLAQLGASRTEEISRDNIRDRRWSLDAAAGLQLTLFRNTSIYVQPGLSWHIPGGSDLENAYTERPFAPELSFGIRVNLF